MTDTDADTEHLQEAKEFLRAAGKDDLAERFDAEMSNRAEAAQQVVEMKTLVDKAETAGLEDDPAVQALRDRADALQADAGLEHPDHHPENLAADHDLDEDVISTLDEDAREALREDLDTVAELEDASRMSRAVKHELDARRDSIGSLLAQHGVEAADLVDDDAPEQTAELATAIDEHGETAALSATSSSSSDRVERAQLEDRRDELQADLAEAESKMLERVLRDRLDTLEAELEGE